MLNHFTQSPYNQVNCFHLLTPPMPISELHGLGQHTFFLMCRIHHTQAPEDHCQEIAPHSRQSKVLYHIIFYTRCDLLRIFVGFLPCLILNLEGVFFYGFGARPSLDHSIKPCLAQRVQMSPGRIVHLLHNVSSFETCHLGSRHRNLVRFRLPWIPYAAQIITT